jgi:hypothetical protein
MVEALHVYEMLPKAALPAASALNPRSNCNQLHYALHISLGGGVAFFPHPPWAGLPCGWAKQIRH